MDYDKYFRKFGLGRDNHYFWKVGKALICTYTLLGIAWFYKETNPLGWWKPKEARERAHLHERREFLYPHEKEVIEELIVEGGMIGTTIGSNGIMETDKGSANYQELQQKKFEQDAHKLWVRMRNEVVHELIKKGYDRD